MQEQQNRLAELFERERSRFIGYAARRLGDISRMDAEDIVADVLFSLFNRVDLYSQVESLTAYVYRSIANRIADYRRRQSTVSLDQDGPDGEAPLGRRLADSRTDTEGLAYQDEVRDHLYEALGRLEPRQRAVWIATEIHGTTFRELAEMWQEPVGTLLSRKSRATKALRAALSDLVE